MAETGVSCEVAWEEAEPIVDQVCDQLDQHTEYDMPAIAHIIEHVIGGLAHEAAIIRGCTPLDILADVGKTSGPVEEWLASLSDEELGCFFFRIKQLREDGKFSRDEED